MKKDSRFDFPDLIGICFDLFNAGSDTVSATLAYVLMFLALNPEAQENCFQEIATNLGKHNFVFILYSIEAEMMIRALGHYY